MRERNAPFPDDLILFGFDCAPLNIPIWTRISSSAQFYWPIPLSLAATPQPVSAEKKKRDQNRDGGFNAKAMLSTPRKMSNDKASSRAREA